MNEVNTNSKGADSKVLAFLETFFPNKTFTKLLDGWKWQTTASHQLFLNFLDPPLLCKHVWKLVETTFIFEQFNLTL